MQPSIKLFIFWRPPPTFPFIVLLKAFMILFYLCGFTVFFPTTVPILMIADLFPTHLEPHPSSSRVCTSSPSEVLPSFYSIPPFLRREGVFGNVCRDYYCDNNIPKQRSSPGLPSSSSRHVSSFSSPTCLSFSQ